MTRATMFYPTGIVFEPQPLTGTTSTWLDIDIHLSRKRGFVFTPARRELTWVNGESSVCQKHVVPPSTALRDLNVTLSRSLIVGRITRWMQFCLSHNQLRDALRHELHLWRRAGYPLKTLRDWWSNQRNSARVRCFARALLQTRTSTAEESSDPTASLNGFLLARPEKRGLSVMSLSTDATVLRAFFFGSGRTSRQSFAAAPAASVMCLMVSGHFSTQTYLL